MTAPPGGPYGQDPAYPNPYWQNPYWGGQPQGGQPQGDPHGGQPQGGPYPGPPASPYQYPQGGPYAAGGYPPQQYPHPGQHYPPGWPGGPYPPGPPPRGPRSKAPWLIGAGIAVIAVVALVVALAVVLGGRHRHSTEAAPSMTPPVPTSQPNSSPQLAPQNATDCTDNVSAVPAPNEDTLSAGPLSFPASAAPGWAPFADNSTPNAIDAVGVAQEVPGANQWIMQAEVMITNFVPSMDAATQASKMLNCTVNGPGYAQSSPTLGPTKTSSLTVDGTEAARVDADITIGDNSRGVPGDSVTVIAVNTKPITVFFGASPIGDAADRAPIDAVIAALKVKKS